MVPPKDAKVTETNTSIYWFDENGILCSISKKAAPQSLQDTMRIMDELKVQLAGRKVCILIDVTNSGESTKELRDYAAVEFPKIVKAMALVSSSELGKMLANLFFNLKQQPYPTKMFTDEEAAREWLKQYL